MEKIFQAVSVKPAILQPQAGEYVDPVSGLIYCKTCHTPRQCKVVICGNLMLPRCTCQCEQERMRKEEEEEKARRFRLEIDQNRSAGLPSPILRKHTFETDLGYNPEAMNRARNYVRHWEEFYKEGIGLLFWGSVGTGKSFLAGCIANALLDKGVRVRMTNCSRILNELSGLRSGENNRFIDRLCAFDLLIIDDLGMERSSEYAREQIFSVIDSRYRSGRPTIYTTNIHLEQMKNTTDLNDQRIFDRVLERCIPVVVSDQHVRKLRSRRICEKSDKLLREKPLRERKSFPTV